MARIKPYINERFHQQLLSLTDLVSLLIKYFNYKRLLLILRPGAQVEQILSPRILETMSECHVLRLSPSRAGREESCANDLGGLAALRFDVVLIDPGLCGPEIERQLEILGVHCSRIMPLSDIMDMELVLNEKNEWQPGFFQLGRAFYEAKNYPKSKLWFQRFVDSQTHPNRVSSRDFVEEAARCMRRLPDLLEVYGKRAQRTKVSVIMATWNRGFIIERALSSALAQSYRNFELIVVDDGSTDDTREVVQSFCGRDRRVHYVRNAHVGVSHARNTGLKKATGRLIAYLDSDNEWAEDYLLLMVNQFVDHPRLSTGYCAIHVIDTVNERNYIRFNPYDRQRLLQLNYIDLNIFMHRRRLIPALGGFDEGLSRLVDWELILRYTKDNPPFFINVAMAKYHLSKTLGNITYTVELDKNMEKVRELHGMSPVQVGDGRRKRAKEKCCAGR